MAYHALGMEDAVYAPKGLVILALAAESWIALFAVLAGLELLVAVLLG